jgi:outer membrane protein assembly factor BamB
MFQPSGLAGLLVTFLVAAPALAADRAEDRWPQFRGPNSSGVAQGPGLPEVWDAKTNIVWQTPIPGRGWSSPIVWGDRIFVTAAVQEEGEPEPVKPGLYLFGERPIPKGVHRWAVYAIDFNSGKVLWERVVHRGVPKQGHHLKNSLASETPVTDGKRVYAYFGNVGLFCFDFEGRQLWHRTWGDFPMHMAWGTAASPVVYNSRVYLVNDNDRESFLVALDSATGRDIWRVARDELSNWSTPLIWENNLRTELVVPGAGKNRAYDLDGKLLWELGGMSRLTIPTPVASRTLVYISSGYVGDKRKPVFAVRPGAKGEISLKDDQTQNEFVAWCRKMDGPYNPSPVLYGGRLYILYDRGMLACYDAETGEELYGKTRLENVSGGFSASPWAYQGKVFCLSEGGQTYVIQAGPDFKLLRVNPLDELCMATPAIARHSLLIRTESKLVRIEQK